MILVTLGTQDKTFVRLLEAIQKEIDKGNIKQKVVVQAGCTKFESKDMEIFDLIPVNEFKALIKKADLIITHGGVGSIMEGIMNHKTIIAAPRLKKYNEHVNDHQLEIIDTFSKMDYILPLKDFDKLDEVLKKATKYKSKEFKSNTNNMVKLIEKFIEDGEI
ncbi:MAG: glycosyltransferase [Bacilli bacterium]|nr:glycosyltransferase [Bacilli bacterium]MDD3305452.1 glycosyltransferase [Bacilli bacterium]MDD4053964.1 glycosyltransferase [Bacilli bacterium]MDD4411430.1 glycosyltransferase [Bacilli bacterium]